MFRFLLELEKVGVGGSLPPEVVPQGSSGSHKDL